MTDTISREEFRQLAVGVGAVEREPNGEKPVTPSRLEQVRRNGDNLAAIKTRMDHLYRRAQLLTCSPITIVIPAKAGTRPSS